MSFIETWSLGTTLQSGALTSPVCVFFLVLLEVCSNLLSTFENVLSIPLEALDNTPAAWRYDANRFTSGSAFTVGWPNSHWDMDDEEQVEVEQRVRDEEPVLLGSPMCRAFSTLIELTRVTGELSEVKHKSLSERCKAECRQIVLRGMRPLPSISSKRWR